MWYEYGRTPNVLEQRFGDLSCVTANYTYLNGTHIGVQNLGYNLYALKFFKTIITNSHQIILPYRC